MLPETYNKKVSKNEVWHTKLQAVSLIEIIDPENVCFLLKFLIFQNAAF